jgi:hypothetical protein
MWIEAYFKSFVVVGIYAKTRHETVGLTQRENGLPGLNSNTCPRNNVTLWQFGIFLIHLFLSR